MEDCNCHFNWLVVIFFFSALSIRKDTQFKLQGLLFDDFQRGHCFLDGGRGVIRHAVKTRESLFLIKVLGSGIYDETLCKNN